MNSLRKINRALAFTLLFWFLACNLVFALESNAAYISNDAVKTVIAELIEKHGASHSFTIERCVRQVASLWQKEDGDRQAFTSFCLNNFIAEPQKLDAVFNRYQDNLEVIAGHLYAIRRQMSWPLEVETGEIAPVDYLFAEYSPDSHFNDDFFHSKLAFLAGLNFPVYSLEEKLKSGSSWSRKAWAEVRLADKFIARVPAAVLQEVDSVYLKADDYINAYNIFMHNILDSKGKRLFPPDLRLISHWGLRDQLTGYYNDEKGLAKQKLIQLIMERIIRQEIPQIVINNPKADWDPSANKVYIEGKLQAENPEPDTRYRILLSTFKAEEKLDAYYPEFPSLIARRFQMDREIPEAKVERLLVSVLSAPLVRQTGKLIAKRLGRSLQPFDIWYAGFAPGNIYTNEELDKITLKKYPNLKAVQDDLVNLLQQLGFSAQKAQFISQRVQIDPARGAGHAMGAPMRGDFSHLRTRFAKGGLNYQGFNILCHELGHCTEQVFSLDLMDNNLLSGVPNIAFSEAFAFAFQAQDLKLLGVAVKNDPKDYYLKTLNQLWSTYEIAGVGLLDMKIWHWMYDHPQAGSAELKKAVLALAKEVWNQYYAPVFGVKDSVILAIYSHIIDSGMYVPDYPLGFIIQFQMEQQFKKVSFACEMERVCRQGMLTPEVWMKGAVGKGISAEPMLNAANEALKIIK